MLKDALKRTLKLFGYYIGHISNIDSLSPFEVQRKLIRQESPMIFDIGANTNRVS